jgi:glycosyltransferase involved in cell wall biosynthesis
MQHLTAQLGLTDDVTFTGWVSSEEVYDYLGTADVGLQPDPKNLRTDLATATKTMEYMAFNLPIVAFDVD